MNQILNTIHEAKKREVEQKKAVFNKDWYTIHAKNLERKTISLKERLLKKNSTGIIAEFKRRSPSKGWFKPHDFPVKDTVMKYESYGSVCISVLTDQEFFGGDLQDLSQARELVSIPLLRKDFIIHEIQIHEAKAYGADVILLIAAMLSPVRVRELAKEAVNSGLEVLLELHEESELEQICKETELIGINNRNLKTFEVDTEHSFRMAEKIPADKIKIAESGIRDTGDLIAFRQKNYRGFLIGESFMIKPDPGEALNQFIQQLK